MLSYSQLAWSNQQLKIIKSEPISRYPHNKKQYYLQLQRKQINNQPSSKLKMFTYS